MKGSEPVQSSNMMHPSDHTSVAVSHDDNLSPSFPKTGRAQSQKEGIRLLELPTSHLGPNVPIQTFGKQAWAAQHASRARDSGTSDS